MDQFDPWQVVPRQVFTSHSHLLIATVFVVVSCFSCLGVISVILGCCIFSLVALRFLVTADSLQPHYIH